jgi:hypothetical protein
MGDGNSGDLSIEAYARIQVALADPEADAAAVLMIHGLDEARWNALDREWQARITAAEAEGDDVPALLMAYSDAFTKAQRQRAAAPIPFERYVELTRKLQGARDVPALLKQLHVTFEQYMAAHAHFAAQMLSDEELAARFARVVTS